VMVSNETGVFANDDFLSAWPYLDNMARQTNSNPIVTYKA